MTPTWFYFEAFLFLNLARKYEICCFKFRIVTRSKLSINLHIFCSSSTLLHACLFVTGTDRPHHVEDALPRGGGGRGMMAHRVITDTGDVLMGTATIPLLKLLANRTGKLQYIHMLHTFLSSSKLGLGIWCKGHFFPSDIVFLLLYFTLAHLILSVLPFTPITLYDILPNIIIVKITIPYDMEYFHISYTVKPRPEAHMDMILFEVFLKNIHLIPLDQIVQWHYL